MKIDLFIKDVINLKKILIDGYFDFNLGDDLFIIVLLERFPNTHFYIFANSNYSKVFSNYKNLHIINNNSILFKVMNKFSNLFNRRFYFLLLQKFMDGTLLIGGSLFIQKNKIYKSMIKKLNCEVRNSKYFICGANFGPYYTEDYYQLYKKIFQNCVDISFRDKYSYDLFFDLKNVRLNPDIVFSLKREYFDKKKENCWDFHNEF